VGVYWGRDQFALAPALQPLELVHDSVQLTGIERVALVVFVRKRMPEIQYLKARISEEQRQEYGRLVAESVRQISCS
jgi:DNA-binding IclR family transcriptional regulator